MKINFSQEVVVSGAPVHLEKDKTATLGDLCREALNTATAEKRLALEDMISRGRLSLRLSDGGEQEITPEESSMIRKALPDRFQHPELVVSIYDLLGG